MCSRDIHPAGWIETPDSRSITRGIEREVAGMDIDVVHVTEVRISSPRRFNNALEAGGESDEGPLFCRRFLRTLQREGR